MASAIRNTVSIDEFERAVHPDHLEFILEIRHGAQAADDHARADIASAVNQQVLERMGDDLDAGRFSDRGAFGLDHLDAVVELEKRALVAVDRDTDHQTVNQN